MKKINYALFIIFAFISSTVFAQTNGTIHFTGSIVNPPCQISTLNYQCYNGNSVSEKGSLSLDKKSGVLNSNMAIYTVDSIDKYNKNIIISYN